MNRISRAGLERTQDLIWPASTRLAWGHVRSSGCGLVSMPP